MVNPQLLGTIRQVKADTGGTYIVDPLAVGPTTLHGVRLISSGVTRRAPPGS